MKTEQTQGIISTVFKGVVKNGFKSVYSWVWSLSAAVMILFVTVTICFMLLMFVSGFHPGSVATKYADIWLSRQEHKQKTITRLVAENEQLRIEFDQLKIIVLVQKQQIEHLQDNSHKPGG